MTAPPPGDDLEQGRRRLRLVAWLFAGALVALGVRLTDLALLTGGGSISAQAVAGAIAVSGRADIVDRNGDLLATDYRKTSVFADPEAVLDPEETAIQLAAVLDGTEAASLLVKLSSRGRFVWLARHITDAEQRAAMRLGLPGIGFRVERHRVYPQRRLTAHVVGYVGVENQGLGGIEKSLEPRLTQPSSPPLRLTIDLGVQQVVHRELSQAVARFAAKGGSGLVLDAASGELLAMVSLPDFDPNRYQEAGDAIFNRNTQGTYEVGSLFKLFTAAMALDAGVTDIAGGYDATLPLTFGRFRVRDFHAKRRWLSTAEIIAFSSNIGAAIMAEELGSERQLDYFRRFGLLDRHPIRLGEVALPQRPATWRPINTITAAYGHGIAVSPLHVVDGLAGILCAGPIAHVVAEGVPELRAAPPVSAETAAKLRWLMWLTVAEGSGKSARVPGYLVGGKTGSAEKAAAGGYRSTGLLSSFVAAVPIDQPRYLILVTLDEPEGDAETYGQATGGWTAAPTVGRIISRIGPLLGLPPIRADAEQWFRDRLIEGEAINGRTERVERSFRAAPDVDWVDPERGETACGCRSCSILG